MQTIDDFNEYQVLDMAHGEKVEKWSQYTLRRPDPQIIWESETNPEFWLKTDAKYSRSSSGGGAWEIKNDKLRQPFIIKYNDLKFNLKLMGFKHTGLFPEQAYNWNYVRQIIKNSNRQVNVLNLFAYTGAMSVAALKEGAHVTHVDSSKGMVDWAKENVKINSLENENIRYIVDDVIKFVKREKNRGQKYDIIVMDPPSFGRGSQKEVWTIEKDIDNLIKLCCDILSDKPLLFLINSYTTGLSSVTLKNLLELNIIPRHAGTINCDELGIKMNNSELVLPCGGFARWER